MNINEIAIELEQAFYSGDVKACRKATRKALNAGVAPLDLLLKDLDMLKYGVLICHLFQKMEEKPIGIVGSEKQISKLNDVKLVFSLFHEISSVIMSSVSAGEKEHDASWSN